MKTQLALIVLVIWSISVCGQDNAYERTMLGTIESLDNAKSEEQFLTCASQFERVARAEKTKWLPYYYGAYSLILLSLQETDGGEKDLLLDRAQEFIDKALELEPEESELHVLCSCPILLRRYTNLRVDIHQFLHTRSNWRNPGDRSEIPYRRTCPVWVHAMGVHWTNEILPRIHAADFRGGDSSHPRSDRGLRWWHAWCDRSSLCIRFYVVDVPDHLWAWLRRIG